MKKIVEGRTMSIVREELNASVERYNESTDSGERVEMMAEHKKLVEEYNTLSLLSTYAKCMDAEKPLIAFAKEYYYTTISTKDTPHNEVVNGVQISTITRSVVEKDSTRLNVAKFIEWTEEKNRCVAADRGWKSKAEAARTVIEDEWKKFFAAGGDTHAVSITATKRALQAMFDALVFIKAENCDKNAVIANGKTAKWAIAFANTRKDSKVDGKVVITGQVLPKATWNTMMIDLLHIAVTGKDFEITYGDPEEIEEEEAAAETANGTAAAN